MNEGGGQLVCEVEPTHNFFLLSGLAKTHTQNLCPPPTKSIVGLDVDGLDVDSLDDVGLDVVGLDVVGLDVGFFVVGDWRSR